MKERKTRQTEFVKLFQNAPLDENGRLSIRPCYLDKKYDEMRKNDTCYGNCAACRETYWSKKV